MLHFRSCPSEEEHADTGESLISVVGGIGEGSGSIKTEKKKNLCSRLTKSGRKGLCPWRYISQAVFVSFP